MLRTWAWGQESMVVTSSGLSGTCSQTAKHSSGKGDICLVQLTQAWPRDPWISLSLVSGRDSLNACWFMFEIQEMQQQAGSGGGEGLLLGTTGGSFQSSLHMPQTCAAASVAQRSCAMEQGACLRQTVSLLQRRLVIGTLRQFSVVFVNKTSLFSARRMKMRFRGLQRALFFCHFICPGSR